MAFRSRWIQVLGSPPKSSPLFWLFLVWTKPVNISSIVFSHLAGGESSGQLWWDASTDLSLDHCVWLCSPEGLLGSQNITDHLGVSILSIQTKAENEGEMIPL